MSNKDSERGNVAFRGTEDYRWMLRDEATSRRLSVQALLEEAVDLFLSVSSERYAAGDIARLKDYAAELAGRRPERVQPAAEPPPLSPFLRKMEEYQRVAGADLVEWLEQHVDMTLDQSSHRVGPEAVSKRRKKS